MHDLVGGDPHLKKVHWQDFCMCFGTCCVTLEMECMCEECDCGSKGSGVTATRAPRVIPTETPAPSSGGPVPAHACQDCGTEVFRNGTRGRFPSRCPACKGK